MKRFLLCLLCALLAITPVLAAAEADHIHTYESGSTEEEIDYDNPSYAAEDNYSHRITYDTYIYPTCDICGQRGSTSTMGEWVEYSAHEWKDGKCALCGFTCEHEFDESGCCWVCGAQCPHNSGTRTWIDGYGSKEGTAVEIPGDDQHHTVTSQVVRITSCSTCGCVLKEEVLDEVTGDKGWHNYTGDGVCNDCGHKCSHSASLEEYSWIEWDEDHKVENINDPKYHLVTGNMMSETQCTNCWATVEKLHSVGVSSQKQYHEWGWDEENDCESNVCTVCGYVSTCEHKNTVEEEENWWDDCKDTGDNTCHEALVHTVHYVICKDCGKTLERTETDTWQKVDHDYSPNGICRTCGHKNTCEHKNTENDIEIDYDTAKYTPIDSLLHRQTGTKYSIVQCSDCRMILSRKAIGQGTDTMPHWYEEGSDTCAQCGYKTTCAHKNTSSHSALWSDNITDYKDVGSNAYHEVSGKATVTVTCDDCGLEISEKKGEVITDQWPHDYDANGVCTNCGHKNTCEHPNPQEEESIWGRWLINDIGNSKQHQVSGCLYKYLYCPDCNTILSKELIDENGTMMRDHEFDGNRCIVCGYVKKAEEAKATTETAAETAAQAETAEQTELVYEPVSDTAEISGVKASDALPMAEALATVGEALDGEEVTIEIPGIEKVLNAEEMARFNKLSVQERLMIALDALGFSDILKAALADNPELLSPEAQALMGDIDERIGAMTPEELEALTKLLTELFVQEKIVIDGKEYTCFCIDLVITRDGEKTYQRYAFRQDDDGQWILCQIAIGEYKPVKA